MHEIFDLSVFLTLCAWVSDCFSSLATVSCYMHCFFDVFVVCNAICSGLVEHLIHQKIQALEIEQENRQDHIELLSLNRDDPDDRLDVDLGFLYAFLMGCDSVDDSDAKVVGVRPEPEARPFPQSRPTVDDSTSAPSSSSAPRRPRSE